MLQLPGIPEASVFWQDSPLAGHVSTSYMVKEQGLFGVRGMLRVIQGINGTYRCLALKLVLQ